MTLQFDKCTRIFYVHDLEHCSTTTTFRRLPFFDAQTRPEGVLTVHIAVLHDMYTRIVYLGNTNIPQINVSFLVMLRDRPRATT